MIGIYQIKNINTGKIYIGSAVNIKSRWHRHKSLLRSKKHCNKHLLNAWHKDGEQSFEWSVIEYVDDKQKLIEREQYHMDVTQCYERLNGYNLCKIAGSTLGQKRSDETKRKMAISRTGILHTDETKKLLSDMKKGDKHWNYGKTLKIDTKEKIGKANSGINHGMYGRIGILNTKSKSIIQLDYSNNIIKYWDSSQDINRKLGFNSRNIRMCCSKQRKTAHGFRWEFKIS